jgi:DTW domain-containing protein YfiP
VTHGFHRDDAMERRCNKCEHLVRQCICLTTEQLLVRVQQSLARLNSAPALVEKYRERRVNK